MNRAMRRAARFSSLQSKPTAAVDSEAMTATSSEGRRVIYGALGLQIDANGNGSIPVDAKRDAALELRPQVDRLRDAVNAIDASSGAFASEWTPDRARTFSAALLAYADAADTFKAEIERLKSKSATPERQAV
jgi:hypothetical protein